MQPAPGTTTLM